MGTPLNKSVLKGFAVLSLFSPRTREVSAASVAEGLGTSHATAHRFLMTLEHAGAVRATKRGYYALGPKIEELGWIAGESRAVAAAIQDDLEKLRSKLNESVMACRLSQHGPVCAAVANSDRAISVNIRVGTLLPMQLTAQGKLWLAQMSPPEREAWLAKTSIAGPMHRKIEMDQLNSELDSAALEGFAVNFGENEPDIAAVAVPVRNAAGRTVLTLSVFGMLSRFDQQLVREAKRQLESAAGSIGDKL